MLVIDLHLENKLARAVDRDLARVATVLVIGRDTDNVGAVNTLPLEQVSFTDRAWPRVVVLIKCQDLNLMSVGTVNQIIHINVNQLGREQKGRSGLKQKYICVSNCSSRVY